MRKTVDRKRLSQIGLLTGIGVLGATAEPANADVITQNKTFTVTSSPAEVNDPGTTSNNDPQSTTATFSQFDPSLGTLTEIDVSLNSTLFGFVSVSASSNSEVEPFASGETDWKASYSVTMPAGVGFSDSKSDFASCQQSGFGALCNDSDSPSFSVAWGTTLTQQSILDQYTGTGTFDATFDLDLLLSIFNEGTPPSAATGGGSATWDPPPLDGLTVTYIFTPTAAVPEPGTLALLGMSAMAGLGFARRRLKPDA